MQDSKPEVQEYCTLNMLFVFASTSSSALIVVFLLKVGVILSPTRLALKVKMIDCFKLSRKHTFATVAV